MGIITVSREFGSGGREIGKRLADELHVLYYDKEILCEIAKRTNLNEGYVENLLNHQFVNSYHYNFRRSFASGTYLQQEAVKLLLEQHKVLRQIAEGKEDCVIVGRAADSALEKYKPLNMFIYANEAFKLERCKQYASTNEQLSDKEIIKKMRQIDKARAYYHDMVSDLKWGEKRGYDLCVNTSNADIKEIVPALAEYIKRWFRG